MKISELTKYMKSLEDSISGILTITGFERNDQITGVDQPTNADERFLINEYEKIIRRLCDSYYDLQYLSKPIVAVGVLYKCENGRYRLRTDDTDNDYNDYEFTSGYGLEFFDYDKYEDVEVWRCSRIEHDGTDYYIYYDKDISLEGLKVRIRR